MSEQWERHYFAEAETITLNAVERYPDAKLDLIN